MDTGEGIPIERDSSDTEHRSNLNISDVFEAISIADPWFVAQAALTRDMARAPPPGGPQVRIVEQPASKALRFRYECEGRSAGSIPGVNSTQDRKSYPTIEISGHTGKAIVVVSCVTKDEPYRPHPHNLVGRDRCSRGVCTLKTEVSPDNCLVSFSNLGIQCVKRRDIGEALRVREELRVDPFKTGYGHRNQPQSIDLNAVRLCFQVFLPDEHGKIRHTLRPAVSDVIYDKKAMSDLQILRVSRSSGSAKGGTEIILLCEKVTREDTAVVLVEEGTGAIWEESANIILIHKQVAIAFTTPPYREPHTSQHVEVQIQIKRITDNARSVGVPFTYIPEQQDKDYLRRKRQKTTLLQQIEQETAAWQQEQKIKSEPSDKASPLHMGSSPHQVYTALEQMADNPYQQWMQDTIQGAALSIPGPSSGVNPAYANPFAQEWPGQSYQALTPNMQLNVPARSPNMAATGTSPSLQVLSPNMQEMSPNMQAISPNMQAMSPNMQAMSPNMHAMSPNMQAMSPNMQAMSPNMQAMSPNMQAMSPNMHAMSPNMQAMSPPGHVMSMETERCRVSPNLGHVSPNLVQQPQPMVQQPMEGPNSTPSLSRLLMDQGESLAPIQLNSGDLSNLSALLGQNYRSNELSDSLNRLSTSDLLNPAELQ